MQQLERAALISLPRPGGGTYNGQLLDSLRQLDGCIGFGALDHSESAPRPFSKQVKQMRLQGFSGVKIWEGKPSVGRAHAVSLDDGELIEALQCAGELDMPVLIHVADPPVFWEDRGMYHKGYPSFDWYIESFVRMLESTRGTIFIGAHMLFLADALSRLDSLLTSYPDLYIDTAPGRWFYSILSQDVLASRRWIMEHRDRILFGSDAMFFDPEEKLFPYADLKDNGRTVETLRSFLSSQESFEDPFPWESFGIQRPKQVRGLGLDEQTLKAIIYDNAQSLLFSTQKR